MQQFGIHAKKIKIAIGVVLIATIAFVVIVVISSRGDPLEVQTVHSVQRDTPFLKICFNQPIKSETVAVEGDSFTFEKRHAQEDTCAAFWITAKQGSLEDGQYVAKMTAESQSGKKISNQEIFITIPTQSSETSLTQDEMNELSTSNTSVEVNNTIAWWKQQPIYEHVDANTLTYIGGNWQIALVADGKQQPLIVILIDMPSPPKTSPALIHIADQYEKEALAKIKEWGFSAKDYPIEIRYADQ